MINLIRFKISDTQYLKINPESIGVDECKFCANIDIDYVDEEKNISIRFGYQHASSVYYRIAESGYIQKLINGESFFDSTVNDDLGYEWNQYFKGM